jgi:hypothetical protein
MRCDRRLFDWVANSPLVTLPDFSRPSRGGFSPHRTAVARVVWCPALDPARQQGIAVEKPLYQTKTVVSPEGLSYSPSAVRQLGRLPKLLSSLLGKILLRQADLLVGTSNRSTECPPRTPSAGAKRLKSIWFARGLPRKS